MDTTIPVVAVIFALSIVMVTSGRGGGDFHVVALVLLGTASIPAN